MARPFLDVGVRAGTLVCRARLVSANAEAQMPLRRPAGARNACREIHPEGYAYGRFCRPFREFEQRLSPMARQQQAAGDEALVDYSSKRAPITDPATGELPLVRDIRPRALTVITNMPSGISPGPSVRPRDRAEHRGADHHRDDHLAATPDKISAPGWACCGCFAASIPPGWRRSACAR